MRALSTKAKEFCENFGHTIFAEYSYCAIIGDVDEDGSVLISVVSLPCYSAITLCAALCREQATDEHALSCIEGWDRSGRGGRIFACGVEELMKKAPKDMDIILYRGEGKWEIEREVRR